MSALIYVGIGVLLGYGLFLGQNAHRRSRRSEDEAMLMYGASLRSLSERMDQLAKQASNHPTQTEREADYCMGQAHAFEIAAKALTELADKAT